MKKANIFFVFCILLSFFPGIIFASNCSLQYEHGTGYSLQLSTADFDSTGHFHSTLCLPDNEELNLVYSSADSVYLSTPMQLRDLNIALIDVYCNPFSSQSCALSLQFQQAGSNIELPPSMSPSYYQLYSSLMPSLLQLDQWREIELLQPSILFIYPQNGGDVFMEAYNYLKEWKAQKGFIIYEFATPSNYSASQIKDVIQNFYDSSEIPPEYVCLIGDAGGDYSIPTSYYSGGEGDHYYTTLCGDDQLSDIHIGRLSFNTINEWQTIVYKIINYEKNPYLGNTDWFKRVLLTGDPTTSGTSCVYTNMNIKEMIENNHPQYSYTEVYNAPFICQMQQGFNQGISYFNYRGYWGMSGWYEGTANGTCNGMMLPFAVISTCDTGGFAGEGNSRSESFIRAGSTSNPRGGIGAVGTATITTHTCFNNCYAMGTAYGLYAEDLQSMGAAHSRGKTALWINYPQNPDDACIKFSYWNNLIGDPSCDIWIGTPQIITSSIADTYADIQEMIHVQIIDQYGFGCSGLDCCLYNTDSNEQHFSYSDNNGYCSFAIDELACDQYVFTVSGKNTYPLQESVEIIDQHPVSVENIQFADQNGNGSFEPFEDGLCSFDIHNNSAEDVSDINISIDCCFSQIDLDYSCQIDDLASGETCSLFDIPIYCSAYADMPQEIICGIHIQSPDFDIYDNYFIPVTYIEVQLEDFLIYDDNDNIPQPGETVYIDYQLHNYSSEELTDLILTVECANNLVFLQDDLFNIPAIPANGSHDSNEPVALLIHAQFIAGNEVELNLRLVSQSGYEQVFPVSFTAGQAEVSQPTGPDQYGYCIYDQSDYQYYDVQYDWIEINDQDELPLYDNGDMGDVYLLDLPFYLNFYNQQYSQLSVCSNGWVSPGYTESASFMNWAIPGEGGISPLIAVFWDDLKIDGNSGIYCFYDEDEHYLIIEWDSLQNDWDNSLETFQLIIYELDYYPSANGNNILKFQYKDFNNTNTGCYTGFHNANHGQFATIGIEDQKALQGLQYSYNNVYPQTGSALSDQSAIVVAGTPVPDDSPWLIINSLSFENQNQEMAFVPGDTVNVILDIKNIGDLPSADIEIQLNADNCDYVQVINDFAGSTPLDPGVAMENIQGLSFYLHEQCPPMENLQLSINISSGGLNWNYPVNKMVTVPLLELNDNNIDFGEVMNGYVADYCLELFNQGAADLRVDSLVSSAENLSFDFSPLTIQPRHTELITLHYLPDFAGEFSHSLSIFCNDYFSPFINVPVQGLVLDPPQIQVDTSNQEIDVEVNTITQHSVTIENSGASSLAVDADMEGFYNSWQGALFSGGYLELSQPVLTSNSFSIEFWAVVYGQGFHFNHTNTAFSQRNNYTGDNRCSIHFNCATNAGTASFGVRGAQGSGSSAVCPALPFGEWHHYCGVVTDDAVQMYFDGILVAAELNEEEGGYLQDIDYITIGAHKYNNTLKASFNGMIDEMRFWNRALDSSEILEFVHKSRPLNSSQLNACWNFNDVNSWQDLVNNNICVDAVGNIDHYQSQAQLKDWIYLEQDHLNINAGTQQQLLFTIDSNWLNIQSDPYLMNIILDSNDPAEPQITVPLSVEVMPVLDDDDELPAINFVGNSYPNPFVRQSRGQSMQIEYSLSDINSDAALVIYNIKGQRVRHIDLQPNQRSSGCAVWDCCSAQGLPVATGVYFYGIMQNNQLITDVKKAIILK